MIKKRSIAFSIAILSIIPLWSPVVLAQLPGSTISAEPGPSINFTATPTHISKGDSVRLTWDAPTADNCQEPDGGLLGFLFNDPNSGSKVVTPGSNTTYTVTCRNSQGTTHRDVDINVDQCPADNNCHGETIDVKVNGSNGPVTFTGLPQTFNVATTVTSTDAWWDIFSNDPVVCAEFDAGSFIWGDGFNQKVTLNDTPSNYGSHFYSATCQFGVGNDSIHDMVEVIIKPKSGDVAGATAPTTPTTPSAPGAPTLSMTANPKNITKGQSSTISWSSTNTTVCKGSRGGSYPTSGSFQDNPSTTTTYAMTCTGSGGSITKTATVVVDGVAPKGPSVDIKAQ